MLSSSSILKRRRKEGPAGVVMSSSSAGCLGVDGEGSCVGCKSPERCVGDGVGWCSSAVGAGVVPAKAVDGTDFEDRPAFLHRDVEEGVLSNELEGRLHGDASVDWSRSLVSCVEALKHVVASRDPDVKSKHSSASSLRTLARARKFFADVYDVLSNKEGGCIRVEDVLEEGAPCPACLTRQEEVRRLKEEVKAQDANLVLLARLKCGVEERLEEAQKRISETELIHRAFREESHSTMTLMEKRCREAEAEACKWRASAIHYENVSRAALGACSSVEHPLQGASKVDDRTVRCPPMSFLVEWLFVGRWRLMVSSSACLSGRITAPRGTSVCLPWQAFACLDGEFHVDGLFHGCRDEVQDTTRP